MVLGHGEENLGQLCALQMDSLWFQALDGLFPESFLFLSLDHTQLCSEDHMGGQGLNLGQLCSRQTPYPLCYQSSPYHFHETI